MESDEVAAYKLPLETMPGLELSHHISDLIEFKDFLENRGIKTSNTRIVRYIEFLRNYVEKNQKAPGKIFKNSDVGLLSSNMDWLLYVLREAHELMWILKGLKTSIPMGLEQKLRDVIGGRDFAALDSDSRSRDTQFELRIASYFCQAGCYVDMSTKTDVIALTDKHVFAIECKRIASESQLSKRISEAKRQLRQWAPKNGGSRVAAALVAVDVTKLAFPHNGMTMGVTNEHSRDVIQKKLAEIARNVEKLPLFDNCREIQNLWLQIHMPSLILQPPSVSTRFSSCHVHRERTNRKQRRAKESFFRIFEACSKGDHRETSAEPLTLRDSYKFQAGTTFMVEEKLLTEIRSGHALVPENRFEEVASITIHDKEHKFTYQDVMLVPPGVLKSDPAHIAFNLVAHMYMNRFPYKEIE